MRSTSLFATHDALPPTWLKVFAPEASQVPSPTTVSPESPPQLAKEITLDSTLREVYEHAYAPLVARPVGTADTTQALDNDALKWWEKLTDNPPLKKIDRYALANFMTDLRKQRGRKGEFLSLFTVRKHCTNINKLLGFCGPATATESGSQNLGLLPNPPRAVKPKVTQESPEGDFTICEWKLMYRATSSMKVPELPYVSARLWWRAFLLVAAYTGLRVGEIMRLRFADLKGDWITVKGTNRKNRKGKKQYLPAIALRAIGDITTEREFIFEYPGYFSGTKARPRNFARRFKTLLNKARIPPARRFGFHGLRKLHAGIIAENEESLSQGGDGIKAAQASLGHGADSTTTTYYVPASVQDKIAAAAIERLPNITPPSEIQRRLFDE